MENGKDTDGNYLDVRKAFDSVPHRRLLHKMKSFGFTGNAFDWIQDFLTGRKRKLLSTGGFPLGVTF